jgi:diketogulonate reductase-like aldo/keto reductase
MLDRRQEAEAFPYCLTHGIGVMGYGSLGHGLLTGAFTAETSFDPARDWRGNGVAFGQPIFRGENFARNLGVIDRLRREVAEPRGVPLSQIDLAWVLGHPAISTALVGARTPAEVDANDAGAELDLSSGERAAIEGILAGVAGRVREFTPLRPAMEPWGGRSRPVDPAERGRLALRGDSRGEADGCGYGTRREQRRIAARRRDPFPPYASGAAGGW